MRQAYGEKFSPPETTTGVGPLDKKAGQGGQGSRGEKVTPYTLNRERSMVGDEKDFPEIFSDETVKRNVREERPEYFTTPINYRGREAKMHLGMTPELFKIYQEKNPDIDKEVYLEDIGRCVRVLLKHIRLE